MARNQVSHFLRLITLINTYTLDQKIILAAAAPSRNAGSRQELVKRLRALQALVFFFGHRDVVKIAHGAFFIANQHDRIWVQIKRALLLIDRPKVLRRIIVAV